VRMIFATFRVARLHRYSTAYISGAAVGELTRTGWVIGPRECPGRRRMTHSHTAEGFAIGTLPPTLPVFLVCRDDAGAFSVACDRTACTDTRAALRSLSNTRANPAALAQ
jgi:hypothetical protein